MKKFELVTDMSISFLGRKLFRIRALVDFTTKWGDTIKAGGLGGYVEKEENLSHEGNAWVSGNARVFGNAWVSGNARVFGNARVSGNAWVSGNAEVSDNARVFGNARVSGNARVFGDARVYDANHVLTVGPIGSRNATTTFFRDKNNEITVVCGCFLGNIEDFLKKVEETHGDNKHAKAYQAAAELAKIQIDLTKEEE